MESLNNYKWLAFISYSHNDIKWAEWLQRKLEFYKLPSFVAEEYPEKPRQLRPIFRDVTDLELGVLSDKIKAALKDSKFLVVICSSYSASSKWVNDEVSSFTEMGKGKYIIPFFVEGDTNDKDLEEKYMPPALRGRQILGANVNELSHDYAAVKVVAAMLELAVDRFWQRYLKAEEEEKQRLLEERNRLLRLQSHYLAEKSFAMTDKAFTDIAKLMATEALPKDMVEPDRPYVKDAEAALRQACYTPYRCLKGHNSSIYQVAYSGDGKLVVSSSSIEPFCNLFIMRQFLASVNIR